MGLGRGERVGSNDVPNRGFFGTSVFAKALSMTKAERVARMAGIVKTPGTLGPEGAWRIDGHRLSVEWVMGSLNEAGWDSDGNPRGLSEVDEWFCEHYGQGGGFVERLVDAACFVVERPEEALAHVLERRSGESQAAVELRAWMAGMQASCMDSALPDAGFAGGKAGGVDFL